VNLKGVTIAVTGATGRIGCTLVKRMEDLGAIVLPLCFPGYPAAPKRTRWEAQSSPVLIDDARALESLPSPNAVINLHWRVDRSLSPTGQLSFEVRSNIESLDFLWEWIEKTSVPRLIHASTIRVFSHLNAGTVSSSTEPIPYHSYGIAKYCAEKYLTARFVGSPTRLTHARLCSVASIGEHPTQLLSRLFASAYHGVPIKVNSGHLSHIFHIDEIADLLIALLPLGEEQRPILAPRGIANEDLAHLFERVTGRSLAAEFADWQPGRNEPGLESDAPRLRASWCRRLDYEDMILRLQREFMTL
jgi:nucleoside-diphosphate-sugar epimerase